MTIFNKEKIIDKLELHKLWIETIGKKGEKLKLDEIDFRHIELEKYPLHQAYLIECIFDRMNLHNKDMYASLICSSTFKYANLEKADFYKADVSYVDFTDANLKGARFCKSDCFETLFVKADLTNAKLVNSYFYLADFSDAVLHNVDISSSSFKGVLLKGAHLKGIKGIEDAFIKSINIGTSESEILLEGEEAKEWLISNSLRDE